MSDNRRMLVRKVFFGAVALVTVMLLVRGLVATWHSIGDEAHMVATSYRFFLGDAPLVDDWSPEQLNGIVMLPFVSCYVLFNGDTEGIFLFMRVSCLIVKLAVLIYGYIRLKDESNYCMIFAALLLFYIFSPFNFDNFTYQVVPIISEMYCLIVIRAGNKPSYIEWGVAGALYAVSIMAQPIWIVSYVLVFSYIVLNRKNIVISKAAAFHIGILSITMYFVLIVFTRTTFSDVLQNVPFILSEPDHDVAGQGLYGLVYENVILVIKSYIFDNKITSAINIVYIIILSLLNKYRDKLKLGMFVCLIVSMFEILTHFSAYTMNWMYIAFAWMAIESLFFINNMEYKLLLSMSWFYFISVALGTNVSLFSSAHALAIMTFVILFYYNTSNDFKWCKLTRCIVMPIVLGYALLVRIFICYSDVLSLDSYKHNLGYGPMKGLYANDENYDIYMGIYNDITALDIQEDDVLFVSNERPLAYLIAQTEFGTMGTPFFYLDNDRLDKYYSMHPEKIPTIVY